MHKQLASWKQNILYVAYFNETIAVIFKDPGMAFQLFLGEGKIYRLVVVF